MAVGSRLKPHAVVIPFPAQGHIAPMMHLSVKLALEGFIITFVNTQHNHAIMKHLQPSFEAQGLDIRFAELRDQRENGSTSGQDTVVELCKSFFSLRPEFEEMVESLLQSEDSPITCMISDLYLYFTQDVATKFGLRRLAFWTASAGTLVSIMAVQQGHRSPQERDEHITWVPGVPPLKVTELNTFLQCFDPQDFMFDVFLQPYRRLKESRWIVINTFEELEHGSMDALREENNPIYTVGPLLPPSYFEEGGVGLDAYRTAALWPEDHSCLRWLNQQDRSSVLYVSFGSVAIMSAQQFEELALGLEASQSALLWVIRPNLIYGDTALFPKGYLERVQGRASFVEWAPQLQVLTHPAVGGFLTHCGWNSTLESISAGVPMLGWPYFADQMLNNRCSVDGWNVGLDFEADQNGLVHRDEVERKSRALMWGDTSSQLKQTALHWRKAAQKSIEVGGSSNLHWKHLVKDIAQSPCTSDTDEQI